MPASPPKPNRRWYQFSLRTLLVGMVLLTAVVGWVGWRMQRARENRERVAPNRLALATIEELGGRYQTEMRARRPRTWLEQLFDDPGDVEDSAFKIVVTMVDLDGSRATNVDLAHLRGLTSLRELRLEKTSVTDAGLKHLSGFDNLMRLDLSATKVTDAGLKHLKGLTNLEYLDLRGTQVTADGVQYLDLRDSSVYFGWWK